MKNFLMGFLTCATVATGILISIFWPRELSLVFNSSFFMAVLMFIQSAILVAYLFFNGGSTTRVQFAFALSLILTASLMYSGFELIATNILIWAPLMQKEYPTLFIILGQFVSYSKNIVSFGFAAIGAGITANIITEKHQFKG